MPDLDRFVISTATDTIVLICMKCGAEELGAAPTDIDALVRTAGRHQHDS